ncbi:hypothetical protein C6A83_24865, partial [Escherichia coli]
ASTIFGVHYSLRNFRICQTVLRRRLPLTCCRKNFVAWWRPPVPAWRKGGMTSCLPHFVRCC